MDFSQFPISSYWDGIPRNVSEITDGLVHGTFLVEFDNCNFILQRMNTDVFPESDKVIENIELVNRHLFNDPNYELAVAALVSTKSNQKSVWDRDGNHWRCFSYVEGSHTKDNVRTGREAFDVARAFGMFSASVSGLSAHLLHETIFGFHSAENRLEQYRDAKLHGDSERKNASRQLIKKMDQYEWIASKILKLDLPLRIAHNDPKLSNVLFDKGGAPLCIIDFDTVMPGSPLHDFGDLVRSVASSLPEDDRRTEEVVIKREFYEALQEGFLSGAGDHLSVKERKNLHVGAAYIIYEQAMRFFVDYLLNDVYYKTEYDAHNFVRAKNQVSLLESFLDFKEMM